MGQNTEPMRQPDKQGGKRASRLSLCERRRLRDSGNMRPKRRKDLKPIRGQASANGGII